MTSPGKLAGAKLVGSFCFNGTNPGACRSRLLLSARQICCYGNVRFFGENLRLCRSLTFPGKLAGAKLVGSFCFNGTNPGACRSRPLLSALGVDLGDLLVGLEVMALSAVDLAILLAGAVLLVGGRHRLGLLVGATNFSFLGTTSVAGLLDS